MKILSIARSQCCFRWPRTLSRYRYGAVLPGVNITLKNMDTGFTASTPTDNDGDYQFTRVVPTWTRILFDSPRPFVGGPHGSSP